ncbi:MAG: aminopeptidase P family protein [Firmicutes bacterium]|nr:aminopeptidase P family protein [Bacillota bacterium]
MKTNSINKIQSGLSNDAYLFTRKTNIHYLLGISNLEGSLLITKNDIIYFTDFRYFEEACNKLTIEVVDFVGKKLECINKHVKKLGINKIYFEKDLPYIQAISNQKFFKTKSISYEMAGSLIEELRIIKTESEIDLIRSSALINDEIFNRLLKEIKIGVTEIELKIFLENQIRKLGGEGSSFDLIVLFGKKTSMPHGVSGDFYLTANTPILIDIGVNYKGYASDMTRTIFFGSPDEDFIEIYEIVKDVQRKALNMVKPGARIKDIDQKVKDVLALKGYILGHSTGHGVGLEIHEAPFINVNNDGILEENMVITIEPGIYLFNKFGVRIEDLVVVTKNGYEILSNIDKELIIV